MADEAPTPRLLKYPRATKRIDHETGTHSYTYIAPDNGLLMALLARTPRTQRATLYRRSPEGELTVVEDAPEQEATDMLQRHLEAQGYMLHLHPLSD